MREIDIQHRKPPCVASQVTTLYQLHYSKHHVYLNVLL